MGGPGTGKTRRYPWCGCAVVLRVLLHSWVLLMTSSCQPVCLPPPSLPPCPACSRRLLYGDQHMEELRRQFMQAYPDLAAPLRHSPHGRLICLRRHAASL